ncbi:MAG: SIS domain-containing protein [Dehalococcoidia bacterium]|nr:MAG: SIS domain-containing protein [Dehalococcoidia bacterium]
MSLINDYMNGLKGACDECIKQADVIEKIADIIYKAYKNDKHIYIFGNGGSATTAAHFTRDLKVGSAVKGKPKVRVEGLADNIAVVTSIANDVDYNSIFELQLIDNLVEGDVVIAISCSGNSPNVIKAVEYAVGRKAVTVGITGFGGGKLAQISGTSMVFVSKDYGQLEDIHLGLAHIISYLVKERISNG